MCHPLLQLSLKDLHLHIGYVLFQLPPLLPLFLRFCLLCFYPVLIQLIAEEGFELRVHASVQELVLFVDCFDPLLDEYDLGNNQSLRGKSTIFLCFYD